jgi:hypothetical protein
MASAEPRSEEVTLANVWRTEPEMQGDFVDAVTGVLTDVISRLLGFRPTRNVYRRAARIESEWRPLRTGS